MWFCDHKIQTVKEEMVLNEAESQGHPADKRVFLHAVTVVVASVAESSCVPAVQ